MSLLKRAAEGIDMKANSLLPARALQSFQGPGNFDGRIINVGEGVTIYPYGNDRTFINEGYRKCAPVYIVVNKIVKKFRQVQFNHYRIKTAERKTYFSEYLPLTKSGQLSDIKVRIEMKRMLKKSVDEVLVDSKLSKFLKKPNRNQTGAKFRGQLLGHKLLTGEGDTWMTGDENTAPEEMFIIPKANLALVKGGDPWDIAKFKMLITGYEYEQPKANIIMWTDDNYDFDPITLCHLRGQSPFDAGLLTMQSINEATETLARMNKNQGAAVIAYRKDAHSAPTPEQSSFMRKQFNATVNDKELAGSIAVISGEWGFWQVGMDARELGLIEQGEKGLETVCYLLDTPYGLFKHGSTYENKPEDKRNFVFDTIAPHAYSLRDEWNEKLIARFGLDRERDVVDCDILALPEMAQDQQKVAEFLKAMGPRLTLNEGREYLGWERSPDQNLDKYYADGTLQSLDQLNEPTGGNLDNELNLLNQ